MFNYFKVLLFVSFALLMACGESDAPQETATTAVETMPAKVETVVEAEKVEAEATVEEVVEETTETAAVTEEVATQLPAEVESVVTAVEEKAEEIVEEVKEEVAAAVEAVAGDKPYQLVDGVISANAVEGWKTYNGGGCGACHGKGGVGAVGPNLGQSVTQKLSKEEFVNIVTNGKPGTMMRPHKTNKRVMDNMDNLYAYLVARGDDVLGPGNLIKLPLGK